MTRFPYPKAFGALLFCLAILSMMLPTLSLEVELRKLKGISTVVDKKLLALLIAMLVAGILIFTLTCRLSSR